MVPATAPPPQQPQAAPQPASLPLPMASTVGILQGPLQAPQPPQQQQLAPVDAAAKLQGLAGGSCPALCFYASQLPVTVGRGAVHASPFAYGTHCSISQDPALAETEASIEFEPLSRTYELRLLGKNEAMVDGHVYPAGALLRLGSGSCVRIGDAEFCVLLPQAMRQRPK